MGTSSSSITSTNVQDQRNVADANAQATNDGGSNLKDYAQQMILKIGASDHSTGAVNANVKITNTDYGAIDKAIKFATSATDSSAATIKQVLGVAEGNFDRTTAALSDAYKDAKGGALVLQNVTIGMMLTIAAIGYFWMKGRKTA